MTFFRKLTTQRLAAVILFFLIFVMAVRIPTDTDTWWHIRSGEYIVNEREIPHTDPFSYTRQGEKWIDHSWGSQIVIYGLYHLFGGNTEPGSTGNIGLAFYTAVLATLGMWFIYQMCEGTVYLRAFIMVLGTASAAVFWSPRPQMFSFVLGAATLYLLHLYKRQRVDRLWIIPLLMLVWANLHGGFAIGFIFLFGTILGEVLGRLLDGDDENVLTWARLRKLLIVTVVSMGAVIVNPYGIQMLAYPFRTVGIGVLQDYIQEWGTPNFHQPQTWPFALLLMGGIAAVGVSSRRIDWTDLTLFVGTGIMALLAGRNIAVFTIAAVPVLSRHLNAWLEEHGWQIHPARRVRGTMLVLNWTLLILIVLAGAVKMAAALNHKTMRDAQEKTLPVEIAEYLDQTPPSGLMFNSYNWGGYLMFAAPHISVYVDGRTDLYDDAFLREYLDIVFVHDGWDQTLEQKEIGFVVIEADTMMAKMLRMQPHLWQEQQFDDGHSALFTRSEAPHD